MNKIKQKYEIIKQKFLDKNCKLLTSYEDYSKLESRYKKVSIVASCGHELHNVYVHTFLNRNTGDKCKYCVKENAKKILAVKSHDCNKIEYHAVDIIKENLSDFYVEKTGEGCLVDIIVKPKTNTNNLYLPIQLKSTVQQTFNCYSFAITKDKYKNMIILLACIKDKKCWIMKNENITTKNKINIGNKSKYNKYMVNFLDLNASFLKLYNSALHHNKEMFDTKEKFNIPTQIYQQRELDYSKLREFKLQFIKFDKPIIDMQVYDFLIDNKKFQEKVCGIEKSKNIYICHLVKNTKNNYELGDNDFYWINIPDENTFYIFPEKILHDKNKIGQNKKVHLLIPFNNDNHWTSKYKFEYNNPNKDEIMKILNSKIIINNDINNESIIKSNIKQTIDNIIIKNDKKVVKQKPEKTNKKCLDCDNIIFNTSTRCLQCAAKNTIANNITKSNRPSLDQLKNDFLSLKSYVNVGKKYNVSDNAIRKWMKSYEKIA
jgi:hypothetical protein